MKLDFSPLEKAVSQLETSLHYLKSQAGNDEGLRKQFRSATIQAFEFTYGLAVKMIRKQLRQIVSDSNELDVMDFMTLIRTAAEANLVNNVPT